jgi:hypothetical protein
MIRVPRAVDEIDAAWLSEALGEPVGGFETQFLEGGVLADAFRLHDIRFTSESKNSPQPVIVKIASQFEKRRAMAIDNDAYVKELNFFRDLAAEMPLRSPML